MRTAYIYYFDDVYNFIRELEKYNGEFLGITHEYDYRIRKTGYYIFYKCSKEILIAVMI